VSRRARTPGAGRQRSRKTASAAPVAIIPDDADNGLSFKKMPGDIYDWLGFEAYDLIFKFLDDVVADTSLTLDVFAYDFNEPDMLSRLEKLGPRLRAIIDDSTTTKKGVTTGHGITTSAESKAAKRLRKSAGTSHVKRTHFRGLQHHKVFIARKNGQAVRVLVGSTNFSFRGIYIQANNVLARIFGSINQHPHQPSMCIVQ